MLSSRHALPFNYREMPDRETIGLLADAMGLDLSAIEADIERQRELSRIAWTTRKDPNWETTQAFHRYHEVAGYQGRQVFYQDWHDVYAVFGLPGGSRDVKTLAEALELMYYGLTGPRR